MDEPFRKYRSESQSCGCEDYESSNQITSEILVELEMDEVLIMDMLESVIFYFCKVHTNELVTQIKDFVMEKLKTFQLRHTVGESSKKNAQKQIQYPCGVCI